MFATESLSGKTTFWGTSAPTREKNRSAVLTATKPSTGMVTNVIFIPCLSPLNEYVYLNQATTQGVLVLYSLLLVCSHFTHKFSSKAKANYWNFWTCDQTWSLTKGKTTAKSMWGITTLVRDRSSAQCAPRGSRESRIAINTFWHTQARRDTSAKFVNKSFPGIRTFLGMLGTTTRGRSLFLASSVISHSPLDKIWEGIWENSTQNRYHWTMKT